VARKERKLSESVEIVESEKTSVFSFLKCKFVVTGRCAVESSTGAMILSS